MTAAFPRARASTLALVATIGLTISTSPVAHAAASQRPTLAPPAVGERAPDFALDSLDGKRVKLSTELGHGPVVLVMLRGWPGYQCPFCVRQFGDFLAHGKEIEATGARVLWVYPGPPDSAQQHAQDFVVGKDVPANFRLLIDPAYAFTLAYGLRWDAKDETAYPSTFVIDASGTVRFARVSRAHDGRAAAADVLQALKALAK